MRSDLDKFVTKYLNTLDSITTHSDYREESLYPYLKELIENITNNRKIQVIQSPGKTSVGYPDFLVKDSNGNTIGYIEAKKPGENLDKSSYQQQIERYKTAFPNFLYTDFRTFRLYRNEQMIKEATINKHDNQPVIELIRCFLDFRYTDIKNPEDLAKILSNKAKFYSHNVILKILEEQIRNNENKGLISYYKSFQSIHEDLKIKDFSDILAQIITHSIYNARFNNKELLSYERIHEYLPKNIPIIRDVIRYLVIDDHCSIKLIHNFIKEVIEVMNHLNVDEYLNKCERDHSVHFYETFLEYYDKEKKREIGGYYTEQPIRKYMVKVCDQIFEELLGISDGLANPDIKIIDPASGTGSFIIEIIEYVIEKYQSKYGVGATQNYIKEHILKDIYGFEILAAPYIIANYNIMNLIKNKYKYIMDESERPQEYLTNALLENDTPELPFPIANVVSEENNKANKIKSNQNFSCVIGNPPYNGRSKFKKGIKCDIKVDHPGVPAYNKVKGKPLASSNSKWLNDDYVAFIRFAQKAIDKNGYGVVEYVLNHSVLDNLTFAGLRYSLLETFDYIFIIDLHGNKRKKEEDENVFNIQQGICILICVKTPIPQSEKNVYYFSLCGTREEKFNWFLEHDYHNTPFEKINVIGDQYIFKPLEKEISENQNNFVSIDEIFLKKMSGISTGDDNFLISKTKEEALQKIKDLADINGITNDEIIKKYNIASRKLKNNLDKVRKYLLEETNLEVFIREILYRPFDKRYVIYHEKALDGARGPLTEWMCNDNIALCVSRQGKVIKDNTWNLVICTDKISDLNLTRGGAIAFPLYIQKKYSFISKETLSNYSNIKESFISNLQKHYNKKIDPIKIFSYVYAILYSDIYRKNQKSILEYNYPRIPFPKDFNIFERLSEIGYHLIMLHIMKTIPNKPNIYYEGDGDDVVGKIKYDENNQILYINYKNSNNKGKYFKGVTHEMWNYKIGGYRVLETLLKSRKGDYLTLNNIKNVREVCEIINATIDLQKEIDKIYPLVEKDTIDFNLY